MLDLLMIFCAKYLFLVSLGIGGVFFLKASRDEQRSMAMFGVASLALMYLALLLSAQLYTDPRPFVVGHFVPLISHSPDNGFPSDHVLLVSAVAALISVFHRRLGIVLWGIVVLVAVSRVYVGVHHVVDVLASMGIATLVTYLLFLYFKRSQFFHLFHK